MTRTNKHTILYGQISNDADERAEILYNHPDNNVLKQVWKKAADAIYAPAAILASSKIKSNLGVMPENIISEREMKSNLGLIPEIQITPVVSAKRTERQYIEDLKKERRKLSNEIKAEKRNINNQNIMSKRIDFINKPANLGKGIGYIGLGLQNDLETVNGHKAQTNQGRKIGPESEILMDPETHSKIRISPENPPEIMMKPKSVYSPQWQSKNYEEPQEMFYPLMKEESQIKLPPKKDYLALSNIGYENEQQEIMPTIAEASYAPIAANGTFTGGAAYLSDSDKKYVEDLKNIAQTESDKKFVHNLNYLLAIERGYNNHAGDTPTNLGVTQFIYNVYRKDQKLPPQNVKNITINDAIRIYYKYFWIPSEAYKLEHPLDLAYFDMYINSNPIETKKLLKKSNNDVYLFIENRKKFYEDVVKNKPIKMKF